MLEIAERWTPPGRVLGRWTRRQVARWPPELRGLRTTRSPSCLLHAYAKPAHEQRVRRSSREEAPDVVVVCSHEVAPEWREYERTSTVVSAYIARHRRLPPRLEERLQARGLARPAARDAVERRRDVGLARERRAARRSSPARSAARSPAWPLRADLGAGRLICVDMGGTSFDVSLVVDGAAEVESQLEIAGHPC